MLIYRRADGMRKFHCSMAEHIFTFLKTRDEESGKHDLSLGREFKDSGGTTGGTWSLMRSIIHFCFKWRVEATHCQLGKASGISLGGWELNLGGCRKKV